MVLEFCCYCNQGYLKPTGDVVLEGEVGINLIDIGSKRIFACDSCGQKQVGLERTSMSKFDMMLRLDISKLIPLVVYLLSAT